MAKFQNVLLATVSLQLFVAAPAAAQLPGASFGKSEAIIGGPSRLVEILAEQGAHARSRMLQPASYAVASRLVVDAATTARGTELVSPGAYSGKPDIFGTVALGVQSTPLNSRWNRVERARVSGAAKHFASALRHLDGADRVRAVNRYVNHRVRFVDDQRQYGRADLWSTADATLRRGRGDCEDYAIAKIQMLRAAGVSDRDLYLVVLKDLVRRADHAVAVVRSGGHMYVLDNGTDKVADTESISDYRPILTFAASGTWTHGYRVSAAKTVLASAAAVPTGPLNPAAAPRN